MQELVRKGDWIQTYKRKQFWPLDPKSEDMKKYQKNNSLQNFIQK